MNWEDFTPPELFHRAGLNYTVALLFEPRDLWIGIYWKRTVGTVVDDGITLYICVVPMLPIRLYIATGNGRR